MMAMQFLASPQIRPIGFAWTLVLLLVVALGLIGCLSRGVFHSPGTDPPNNSDDGDDDFLFG
jgi:hypothetical protein